MKNNTTLRVTLIIVQTLFCIYSSTAQGLEEVIKKVRLAYGDNNKDDFETLFFKYDYINTEIKVENTDPGMIAYQRSLDPTQGNYEKYETKSEVKHYIAHQKNAKTLLVTNLKSGESFTQTFLTDEKEGVWVNGIKLDIDEATKEKNVLALDIKKPQFSNISDFELKGKELLDGKDMFIIFESSQGKKYFIDPETYYIVKEEWENIDFKNKNKIIIKNALIHSKFIKVGKCIFPFRNETTSIIIGSKNFTTTVEDFTEIEVNKKIPDDLDRLFKSNK